MKNKILPIFAVVLFGLFSTAFSNEAGDYMSVEEYERLFEMGLEDDNVFIPQKKEHIETTGEDVITVDRQALKLKAQKINIEPYKQTYEKEDTKNELFKTGKISVYSDGKTELSNYMTTNFTSKFGATYDLNKNLILNMGHETSYVNPDATIGSRKFYINPRLNLTDNIYLDYTGRYNQDSGYKEQEIGFNYKPKIFKNSASFGIKATGTSNENNEFQSGKLKFTTDFYFF